MHRERGKHVESLNILRFAGALPPFLHLTVILCTSVCLERWKRMSESCGGHLLWQCACSPSLKACMSRSQLSTAFVWGSRCFIIEWGLIGALCVARKQKDILLSLNKQNVHCAALTHLYKPDNTFQTWRRAVCLGSLCCLVMHNRHFHFSNFFMVHDI